MNKPRWSDKWRALTDSRRARGVAQETTSPSTTMAQDGASGVITTNREALISSFQTAYVQLQEREYYFQILEELKRARLKRFYNSQNSQVMNWSVATWSNSDSLQGNVHDSWVLDGTRENSVSSSLIETKKEPLSVSKEEGLVVDLSILIGDRHIT